MKHKRRVSAFKIKNTVDGTNRRLDTIEEKISEPEHLSVEIIQNDTHRKEKKKKKQDRITKARVSVNLDQLQRSRVRVTGVSAGAEAHDGGGRIEKHLK